MKTMILILCVTFANISMAGGNVKTIKNSPPVRLENKVRLTLSTSKSLTDNKLEGKQHGYTDLRSIHNSAFKRGK